MYDGSVPSMSLYFTELEMRMAYNTDMETYHTLHRRTSQMDVMFVLSAGMVFAWENSLSLRSA